MLILLAGVCAACSATQEVAPLASVESREVCIVENGAVRPDFLNAYRSNLAELGYQVQIYFSERAARSACAMVSTYDAEWAFERFSTSSVYMSEAEIRVYQDGQLAGSAVYDSPRRSADAEPKIRELVQELFPQVQ
jgi:hypothetical protein